MMRAVLDTNILVSALIKPQGSLDFVLMRLRIGDYTLLYSNATLEELTDVLNRPRIRGKYGLTDTDIQTVIALILLRGEPVSPINRLQVCRDPRDDKFLEIALEGNTDVIVSGDQDLLALHPFRGIPVVPPAAFLVMLDGD